MAHWTRTVDCSYNILTQLHPSFLLNFQNPYFWVIFTQFRHSPKSKDIDIRCGVQYSNLKMHLPEIGISNKKHYFGDISALGVYFDPKLQQIQHCQFCRLRTSPSRQLHVQNYIFKFDNKDIRMTPSASFCCLYC